MTKNLSDLFRVDGIQLKLDNRLQYDSFSRKSPSKILKCWWDQEIKKKVGGFWDFEQNMCRKKGF